MRIKELRERKGYNMRQMSKALNIPYTTYVNYEKGEREPNSEMLVLMAKFFGTSVDYIVGRTDEIKPISNGQEKTAASQIQEEAVEKIKSLTDQECQEVFDFINYLKSKRK